VPLVAPAARARWGAVEVNPRLKADFGHFFWLLFRIAMKNPIRIVASLDEG